MSNRTARLRLNWLAAKREQKQAEKAQERLAETLRAAKSPNPTIRVQVFPLRWLEGWMWCVEECHWPDATDITLAKGHADTREQAEEAAANAKAALERGEVVL